MRKLIAKLPSLHLIDKADNSGLSFFTPVYFTRQSLYSYYSSSPEKCTAKEYPGSFPAVLNHSIYIRSNDCTVNIRCQTEGIGDGRIKDPANFFSYRAPANSIHINRNRFTNIKSKTFT